MKKYINTVVFAMVLTSAFSQPLTTLPYEMNLEIAEEEFEKGEYLNA